MLNPFNCIRCLIHQVHKFYDLSDSIDNDIKEQFADNKRQQNNFETCKRIANSIGDVINETQQNLDDLAIIRGRTKRTYRSNANTTS